MGLSHLPQVLQFKVDPMSQHKLVGSVALYHLITSHSQPLTCRRLKRKALNVSSIRAMRHLQGALTAHYLKTLQFCKAIHLKSQTSSEVYNLVL